MSTYRISRIVSVCPCACDFGPRILLTCPEFADPLELATQMAGGAQVYELGVNPLPGVVREFQEGKPPGHCDPDTGVVLPMQDIRAHTWPRQDRVFVWLGPLGEAQYLGATLAD